MPVENCNHRFGLSKSRQKGNLGQTYWRPFVSFQVTMKPLGFLLTASFKKKVAFSEGEPVQRKVILVFLVNNIFSKIFGTSNGHMPVVNV